MTHELAQKLHDDLADLVKTLTDSNERFDHIVSEFCERIVERNGALAHVTFASTGDVRSKLEKILIEFSAYDEYLRKQIRSLDIDVFTAKENAERHQETFRELWNRRSAELGDIKVRLDRAQTRLREHAINSPEVRDKVWAITEGRCIYCDVELTRERDPGDPQRCFVVDHVVPKAAGGPDHLTNYVPACASCNGGKAARPWFDFVRKRHAAPDLKIVGGSEA
jgi:5-methylcytosine-specific restriction endonuclease McrA